MANEDLMEQVGDSLESLVRFVETQAPLFGQEIAAWAMWSNLIWVVGLTCVIIGCLWLGSSVVRSSEKSDVATKDAKGFRSFMWIVAAACGLFDLIAIHYLVRAIVAPRIIIFEYFQNCIN